MIKANEISYGAPEPLDCYGRKVAKWVYWKGQKIASMQIHERGLLEPMLFVYGILIPPELEKECDAVDPEGINGQVWGLFFNRGEERQEVDRFLKFINKHPEVLNV